MNDFPSKTDMIVVSVIVIISVSILIIGVAAPYNPVHSQTASATTDYFSWSCQQLQAAVDNNLAQYSFYSGQASQVVTANNLYVNGLLQIMQLKGCSVSP